MSTYASYSRSLVCMAMHIAYTIRMYMLAINSISHSHSPVLVLVGGKGGSARMHG